MYWRCVWASCTKERTHIYTSTSKRVPAAGLNEHSRGLQGLRVLFLPLALHVHRFDFPMAACSVELDAGF